MKLKMPPTILCHIDERGVLRVTINRPDRMNAVTEESLIALRDAFASNTGLPSVRVAVLEGAGRAFCTGADLSGGTNAGNGTTPGVATLAAANAAVTAIRDFPVPVIAALGGPAAGVGVSLALAADLVVARESAYLLLAFTNVGLMPDGGATALIAASIGRARAMKLALLAERFPARQALDAGLIAEVYADDAFDAALDTLASRLADGPSGAYGLTKRAINASTLGGLDAAFARETEGQVHLLASPEFREGAVAFLHKRRADFRNPPSEIRP